MVWAQVEDLKINLNADNKILYYVGAAIGLVVLLLLLKSLLVGKKKAPDLQKGLRENLKEYPPPPAVGSRRLTLHGIPVRLRLVVVAPTGKQHKSLDAEEVAKLLDEVQMGLGALVKSDKPRIKVWPPQLSSAGFAPTFHRLIQVPEQADGKTPWILVAGPAKTAERPFLLGLALLAEKATKPKEYHLEAREWAEALRVEKQ